MSVLSHTTLWVIANSVGNQTDLTFPSNIIPKIHQSSIRSLFPFILFPNFSHLFSSLVISPLCAYFLHSLRLCVIVSYDHSRVWLRDIVVFWSQQQNKRAKDGGREVFPSLPTFHPPSNPLKALRRLVLHACLCLLVYPLVATAADWRTQGS